MKKIIVLTCMLLGLALHVLAASDTTVVYIKRGALPPDVAKQFEQTTPNIKSVEDAMQAVDEFKDKVDPREIGLAIDTVSTILSRQSNKFADSRVGSFTINLILWRIFGHGIRIIMLKIIFFIVSLIIFCVTWRRTFSKRHYAMRARVNPKWFKKNEIIELFNFDSANDLIEDNSENEAGEGVNPEIVMKISMLIFLAFASLITLFG